MLPTPPFTAWFILTVSLPGFHPAGQTTRHKTPFWAAGCFFFFTLQLNTFVHKFPLYTCVIFHIYLLYLLHVYLCTGRPVPAEESHLQIFPLEDRSWWSASGRLCHRWWRAPWETFRKKVYHFKPAIYMTWLMSSNSSFSSLPCNLLPIDPSKE